MIPPFAALALFFLVASMPAGAQTVIRVDASAAGANDGTSWADAFTGLQDALSAAISGDSIWVAAGTYTPAPAGGNRAISFALADGIAVYGGFPPGGGDGTFGARNPDPETNNTVLSGDLDGNDGPAFANRSDNARHVVTTGSNPGSGAGALLDGFTIRGGHAVDAEGGGLFLPSGGISTLRNLTVTDNWADRAGGGARLAGSHRVENAVFAGNHAVVRGGGADVSFGVVFVDSAFVANTADLSGGGVSVGGGVIAGNPHFVNVRFSGNSAGWRGGGAFGGDSASPVFVNSVFSVNSAVLFGGAFASTGGEPQCINSTFFGNTSGDQGGALFAETIACSSPAGAFLSVFNCVFAHNAAANEGGALFSTQSEDADLRHCLFWRNGTQPVSGPFTSSNPVFDDGTSDADPHFVDASGPDGIFGTRDDDLRVRPGAPAVDAGDATLLPPDTHDIDGDLDTAEALPLDLDAAPRVHGVDVDIGAHENSAATWFVDASAAGGDNGTSWTDASTDLQAVLAAAQSGDEIRIAAGTYKPTTGADRSLSFDLVDGVALIGGFPNGGGNGTFGARDPDPLTNNTVLSGDLGVAGDSADDSFHVVRAGGVGPGTVLDGFTITRGNASGPGDDSRGGGILVEHGSRVALRGLFFDDNAAAADGGAMAVIGASPSADFSLFQANSAARGGALYVDATSTPRLAGLAFYGNTASISGGAFHNEATASITLANGLFSANTAANQGGGVWHAGGRLALVHATFRANAAAAGQGGAIHTGSGATGAVLLANSILRASTPQHTGGLPLDPGTASNLVGDGSPATDPQFADPAGPDTLAGTVDDDLSFPATSIAFDAGDAALLPDDTGDLDEDGDVLEPVPLDLGGNPRRRYAAPDQGAMEVPNVPTLARDDVITFDEDPPAPVIIDVLADNGDGPDTDADSTIDPASVTLVNVADGSFPQFGTLEDLGNGVFSYEPEPDFNGVDSFRYFVRDTLGVPGNVATVTIHVTAVNDPPEFDGGPGFRFAAADGSSSLTPAWATSLSPGGGDDEAAQALNFVTTVLETTGTLAFTAAPVVAVDGTLSFTLAAGTSGLAVVKVELIDDGGGGTNTSAPKFFTIGAGGSFTFFVDTDAAGSGAATSWPDAQTDLAGALMLAHDGDEIWVAEGVYKPTAEPVTDENKDEVRQACFALGDGVRVYGGFTGGETMRAQRNSDPATNNTVLSGDIGVPGDAGDNCYHVVTVAGTLPGTIIDGFTITGGNASHLASGNGDGGGVFSLHESGPQMANLIISGNSAIRGGGFAARYPGGAAPGGPTLTNVSFVDNTATWIGGGIYHYFNGRIDLDDVEFDGNHAGNAGGAIHAAPSLTGELVMVHTDFTGNSTGGNGGAIDNSHGMTIAVRSALFSGNTAGGSGGGIHCPEFADSMELEHVTFMENTAGTGGGVHHANVATVVNAVFNGNIASTGDGGGLWSTGATIANATFAGNAAPGGNGGAVYHRNAGGGAPLPLLRLGNVTVAANTAGDAGGGLFVDAVGAAPLVTNSVFSGNAVDSGLPSQIEGSVLGLSSGNNLVEHGYPGFPGFIDDNALFVDNPDSGDDDWSTSGDNDYGDLHLYAISPAIDAGDAGTLLADATDLDGDLDTVEPLPFDLDGNPRVISGILDLGAFEGVGAPLPPGTTFGGLFPGLDPFGDENGDGVSNYHSYAAGFLPAATLEWGKWRRYFSAGGQFFYEFTRRFNADDVYTSYQESMDLIHWDPVLPGIDFVVEDVTFLAIDREKITLRLLFEPSTQPILFWRQIFSTDP